MLPLEHPDRIHVAFDDHRLVANAGCCCRSPWPTAWAWVNWWTATLTGGCARTSQRWRQDADPGGVGAGGRRLH